MFTAVPTAAHIMDSQINPEGLVLPNSFNPPQYSAPAPAPNQQESTIERLPSYNDLSNTTIATSISPPTKEAPPEALSSDADLEAAPPRVPCNSITSTYRRSRPTRRARICASIGIGFIVVAVVLFFVGMFVPRHADKPEEAKVDDTSIVRGDEGVVFRRDSDGFWEDAWETLFGERDGWQGPVGGDGDD